MSLSPESPATAAPPGYELEERPGAFPRELSRRVLLLETDERAGLVASIAAACHACGVSLEITTGMSHVLLTFEADGGTTDRVVASVSQVEGVAAVHPYTVMATPSESQDCG